MKHIFIAVIMLLTIAQQSFAQTNKNNKTTLTGTITNAKTGEQLAGASIYFPDLKKGSIADGNGHFAVTDLPQGKVLMEVSYLGFSTLLETVETGSVTVKNIAMSPSYIETEAVTVTGVSSATSVRRTPVPVAIVKKDDLLRGAATNLIDALSRLPGIAQIATGPGISKPVIRGLGYNRVVVVNDGIRQEGQQWGDEHGIEIDEYNVNKAEILKGPASLMYGSDALAGVMNFISVVPVPHGTIKGNVLGAWQSNNRQRGFHADVAGNHNGLVWGLNSSLKAAADYKNKYDGYVFNSKFNEKDFGAYIGLNKHWGYSHLLVSKFDQQPGLIEGTRDSATGRFIKAVNDNGSEGEAIAGGSDFSSTQPFLPRQRIQHTKITSDNSFNIGRDRLTVAVGLQRNQRQEFGDIFQPDQYGLYFDLQTINYNVQYHFHEKNNWKTSIGVNGMNQENKNRGIEYLIPDYHLLDAGAFIYTQKRWRKLTMSGGARFDNRQLHSRSLIADGDTKFTAFDKHFSNVSGSAGISYEAGKAVTLKLNVARGFRAPGIPELASNGAHEGTNRYEYGNRNLQSENSLQIDAGVEVGTEHVSLAANFFYNSINNFIYARKLAAAGGGDSVLQGDEETLLAFAFNQANARLYGAEANLDIHPHPLDWLHLENTFSYVRGTLSEAQNGSNNLPFIPAARLINQVKVEFLKKGKAIRNLYAKLELDNTFAQNNAFTGFNTETNTPGYSLLNAGFGSDVMCKGKVLFSLFFSGNNLTDMAYQNHLSRLKYTAVNNVTGRQGVFNMGRNFSMKLNVPLSF